MATTVSVHLAAAIVAVLLGLGIGLMRRGTPRHRWLGRVWVAAMVVTATTSFGIRELAGGHLSWLHALSAYVLVGLGLAVLAIRRRDVTAHRRHMLGLYAGLVIAGVAAVAVPGRVLSNAAASLWQHRPWQVAVGTVKLPKDSGGSGNWRGAGEEGDGGSNGAGRVESEEARGIAGDKQAGAPQQTQRAPDTGSGLLALTSGRGATGMNGAQE